MSAHDQVKTHKKVFPKKLHFISSEGMMERFLVPDQNSRNYHVGAKWPTPFSADQIWLSPCIEKKKKLRGAQHEA